jgi:hypothetical protein
VCNTSDPEETCILTKEQRTMIFLKKGVFVPKDARCCTLHMYKRQLTYESIEMIQASIIDNLFLNVDDVKNLINDFRLAINNNKSFDFDNPGSLDNEAYQAITGLTRG